MCRKFLDFLLYAVALITTLALSCTIQRPQSPATESSDPLRVSMENPRYFTDNSARAIYLTGFHTWANFQEIANDTTKAFDYTAYLDLLAKHNCNFIRLWTWENNAWASWAPDTVKMRIGPMFSFRRTGPSLALDSLPRFDLNSFNPIYFERLRERVQAADERGIYVMVMLFQGWSIERKGESARGDSAIGNPWRGHPFHLENNINGIDGDQNGDGEGEEIHMLLDQKITDIQKAYIRKVIDSIGDLDNVLYEISNESNKNSTAWQYAMIDYIHAYEDSLRNRHPVVMTFHYEGGKNSELFDSPADGISPNPGEDNAYRDNPPANDGRKVILADTDHLWGIGGNRKWVWKCFTRGLQPVFMDPLEPLTADQERVDNRPDWPEYVQIRRNMGFTRMYAERINLINMTPRPELAGTGYCLAGLEPGQAELIVYLPEGGQSEIDLSAVTGKLEAEWFDPTSGSIADRFTVDGGGKVTLAAPFGGHAVLYLYQK